MVSLRHSQKQSVAGAVRTYHPDFPAYGDDADGEDFAYRHEKISHEEYLHLTSSLSVFESSTHAGTRWEKGDGAMGRHSQATHGSLPPRRPVEEIRRDSNRDGA